MRPLGRAAQPAEAAKIGASRVVSDGSCFYSHGVHGSVSVFSSSANSQPYCGAAGTSSVVARHVSATNGKLANRRIVMIAAAACAELLPTVGKAVLGNVQAAHGADGGEPRSWSAEREREDKAPTHAVRVSTREIFA